MKLKKKHLERQKNTQIQIHSYSNSYKNILNPLENGFWVFEIDIFDFQYLNLTGSGEIVGRSETKIYFLLSSYYFSKYTKELSLNYNEGLISAAFQLTICVLAMSVFRTSDERLGTLPDRAAGNSTQ